MKKKSKPLVKQIRVVIADDHPIVREGLGALVSSQQDMKIVSEAANGRADGAPFGVGLNLRVADPSWFFEGSEGLVFSSAYPQLS
jgi:hypothetical protein